MTICSLVVHVKPQKIRAVKHSLIQIQGVEIPAESETGKMVVCIDHPSREHCSQVMTDMVNIDGVMSTSLVFEYQEDAESG